MRAVIQRVSRASVTVDGQLVSEIGRGFMILFGVAEGDSQKDMDIMLRKITKLRVFADDAEKMNLSVGDVGGEILLVSQFTLCADCRHGNRPSFVGAMAPDRAKAMYEDFGRMIEAQGIPVKYGVFGAMMDVALVNDGPVTIMLESRDGAILA